MPRCDGCEDLLSYSGKNNVCRSIEASKTNPERLHNEQGVSARMFDLQLISWFESTELVKFQRGNITEFYKEWNMSTC